MKLKAIKIFLFLFLLTAFCNNLLANIISVNSDTTEEKATFFDDEIKQYAEDSLKLSIDGKKAFLYGNAKIEYQKIIITASYIEIDWNKNTILACTTSDSLGNKIGHPIFKEGNESFKAHQMTYNFKTKDLYESKL